MRPETSLRATIAFSSSLKASCDMKKARRKTPPPRGPTTIDAYIGARMRESRLVLNMSQADLGKKLGVTFQQIQKYESGKNRISAARLYDACKTLNVSLSSMFEHELKG
jgi:DNA-binding XRE family transcriptional regulator